jgi:uncharacterized protein (TIGR03000 family)
MEADASESVTVAKPAIENDAALLTVNVAEDAKVTVNGHETTSDGPVRQFMSKGLEQGLVYTYLVEVTYDAEGEAVTESKSVKLSAGSIEELKFERPEVQPEPVADAALSDSDLVTVVKLHVPADATVQLAGNEASGEGTVRTFRTNQLKAGEQWLGYTVQVTAMVNGQALSQERTVDLSAGSNVELTFDFDANQVAGL